MYEVDPGYVDISEVEPLNTLLLMVPCAEMHKCISEINRKCYQFNIPYAILLNRDDTIKGFRKQYHCNKFNLVIALRPCVEFAVWYSSYRGYNSKAGSSPGKTEVLINIPPPPPFPVGTFTLKITPDLVFKVMKMENVTCPEKLSN